MPQIAVNWINFQNPGIFLLMAHVRNFTWHLSLPVKSHLLIKPVTGIWRPCASDQWRASEVGSTDCGVKESDKAAVHVENWDLPAEFWGKTSTHQGQMASRRRRSICERLVGILHLAKQCVLDTHWRPGEDTVCVLIHCWSRHALPPQTPITRSLSAELPP